MSAAWQYVGSGTDYGETTTVTLPSAGARERDLTLAMIVADGSSITPTITAPSGFVLIATHTWSTAAPDYFRASWYYRIGTSSEPANYIWTITNSFDSWGGFATYRGGDFHTVVDAYAESQSGPATSVGFDFPAVTLNQGNELLVGMSSGKYAYGNGNTPPAGYTARVYSTTAHGLYIIDKIGAVSGAQSSQHINDGGGLSGTSAGIHVGIKPRPVGAVVM